MIAKDTWDILNSYSIETFLSARIPGSSAASSSGREVNIYLRNVYLDKDQASNVTKRGRKKKEI
jgi:hypothetical protein